jgi:integrase
MKVALTDRKLRSLKPAPAGERYNVMDAVERQFGARVNDRGAVTLILYARFPGSGTPARRSLGEYPSMTLAEGRAKAKAWREMISRGVDPQEAERQERERAARARKNTIAAVLADFARDRLAGERKGREVERDLRQELGGWLDRPVSSITAREIRDHIKTKKATAPAQARNVLGSIKRLFDYAVDEDAYGMDVNPAAALKPNKLIGEKVAGQRVLSDPELFALWRAATRMPYPVGPVYQLLMLTALRLNEVADASWSEFDLQNRTWVIPARRMKGKNSKARPHAVPITDDLLAILNKLPRFADGDFVFSTTFGRKPSWIGSKVKNRIDECVLRTLRALARRRGDDPNKAELPSWTNHDIRRTIRSQLSRIKTIPEEVREAVLAHVRPGIKGVYDHHEYFDEKRAALVSWVTRLRGIVEPQADNVVPLRKGGA